MFLILTDEQQMLQDSVKGLLGNLASAPDADNDFSTSCWVQFAAMGLLAMPFAEADGGLGSSAADMMIVMQTLGKYIIEVPFLASAILGGHLLGSLGSPDQKATLLPDVMAGTATLAFAHSEPGAQFERAQVTVRAERGEAGYRVSGQKSLVLNGAHASHFVVSARSEGNPADTSGIVLLLVPSSLPGVTVTPYAGTDATTMADIIFSDVIVPADALMSAGDAALEAIETALDCATVAAIAEAVGAMEELLALTVDYIKVRKQFGVPVGSFQSVQHRAVDLFLEVEQAKSMAIYAVAVLTGKAADRKLAVAAAKAHANSAARLVGEGAVQLHGAIGMTMESKAGRLFRRLTTFQLSFGDRDYCLRILAAADTSILEA